MTPRDALAAALVGCRVTTGTYTAAEGSADRILSALEGWVLVPDPAPLDVERLRDWWDSLSELDQFNAYRIEKSNADALAAPDPAPWEPLPQYPLSPADKARLSPAPDPAPLDVERLARALHRSYDRDPAVRRIEWADLNDADRGMWRRHTATVIREYAKEPQP
jgi:hypothetical protein